MNTNFANLITVYSISWLVFGGALL